MSRRFSAAAFLAVALLPAGAVMAQEEENGRPNYDFVALQYVYNTANVTSDVLPAAVSESDWYFSKGGQLDGSLALLDDHLLLRGSYYLASDDFKNGEDIDFSTYLVGVGWIADTGDNVGIDASIEYRRDEIEYAGADSDIGGMGLSFGLRIVLADVHDLSLRFGVYGGDFDQSIALRLAYAWNLTDNLAVTAGYEYSDISLDGDGNTEYSLDKWLIGGRFYFCRSATQTDG